VPFEKDTGAALDAGFPLGSDLFCRRFFNYGPESRGFGKVSRGMKNENAI
jgi:hypothetical protein